MTIIVTSTGDTIFELLQSAEKSFRTVEHPSPAKFDREALLVKSPTPPFERKIPVGGKKDGEVDQLFDGHPLQPGQKLEKFYLEFGYSRIECQ